MGNLVPQTGGTAVAAYGGANPWAEAARGVESGAYLKFNGNDGRYSFGQDDEDLPHGSRVVGDMESLALGWICWVDSSVEEEVLVPVIEGKAPFETELTDHGPYDDDDGWREAASIGLVLESYGDDDQDEAVGTQLLWKTSTGGQVRQIKKLSGAYGRVFTQHPGEFPIVELGAESYAPKQKKHGKIKWSPVLKIVGWISAAELEGLTGAPAGEDDDFEEPAAPAEAPRRQRAEPAPEPEAAPARGRRAAAPPADEPEEEVAPAPARRSRAAAPPVDEPEEEAPAAPAPRGRRGAAVAPPVDEPEEEEPAAPPVRGRRGAAAPEPADDEGDEQAAPPPRGRSAGRGAPPANARVRNFN